MIILLSSAENKNLSWEAYKNNYATDKICSLSQKILPKVVTFRENEKNAKRFCAFVWRKTYIFSEEYCLDFDIKQIDVVLDYIPVMKDICRAIEKHWDIEIIFRRDENKCMANIKKRVTEDLKPVVFMVKTVPERELSKRKQAKT